MTYAPRTRDQMLALKVNAGIEGLAQEDASPDMVEAVVEGIARLAAGEWAPLNRIGDTQGAKAVDGEVSLPQGFAEAYEAFYQAGWNGISAAVEHGGQGLPGSLGACVLENLGTANMAFGLLPMLSIGAIEAIHHHGSDELKAKYLAKLISGEWSGTMNLTEPQAGSDVGALRTTATPIAQGPHAGKYRIAGTKIFITWGEHRLAENIVHLVLARLPDAPAGSRGISLFLVSKFHLADNGTLSERNDVVAASIERKMGIHASPTCVMNFGVNGECIGELIGSENEGLRCMFTMMNNARVNVGSQGVQIAERATQQATAYALQRIQSARAGSAARSPVVIAEHPDVRRMLVRMRALTDAARALLYYTTGQIDRGRLGDSAAAKRAEVLVPMLKAWGTDIGCEVASLGVQVHGGMGFIEETGAAQYFRDVRIAPIYEGTNGIQAADLVTRKLTLDNGGALAKLMADAMADTDQWPEVRTLASDCSRLAQWMRETASLDDKLAGSVPFCTMCAVAVAGWQMARQVRALEQDGSADLRSKRVAMAYFEGAIASEARGLASTVRVGSALLYACAAEDLAA